MKCGDFVYNKEIKERYLETLNATTARYVRGRFEYLGECFEEPLDRDILEVSKEDFCQRFNMEKRIDIDSVRVFIAAIRGYNDWAHRTNQQLKFTDMIDSFDFRKDVDYTLGIKDCIQPSPEALIQHISKVYDLFEGFEVVPALIFAWLGFDINDAPRIKKEQVNFDARIIYNMDGSVYQYNIPECFWEVLRVYAKTFTATRFISGSFPVYADDLGFFIKRMLPKGSKKYGTPYTGRQITSNIGKFMELYERKYHEVSHCNYTAAARSGVLYRLYELESSGVDLYAKASRPQVDAIIGNKIFMDAMTIYEAYRRVYYPRNK